MRIIIPNILSNVIASLGRVSIGIMSLVPDVVNTARLKYTKSQKLSSGLGAARDDWMTSNKFLSILSYQTAKRSTSMRKKTNSVDSFTNIALILLAAILL